MRVNTSSAVSIQDSGSQAKTIESWLASQFGIIKWENEMFHVKHDQIYILKLSFNDMLIELIHIRNASGELKRLHGHARL